MRIRVPMMCFLVAALWTARSCFFCAVGVGRERAALRAKWEEGRPHRHRDWASPANKQTNRSLAKWRRRWPGSAIGSRRRWSRAAHGRPWHRHWPAVARTHSNDDSGAEAMGRNRLSQPKANNSSWAEILASGHIGRWRPLWSNKICRTCLLRCQWTRTRVCAKGVCA